MKMKKLFAGLVATSMVAAMGTAFAAPVANDAGYNKEAGTYSIMLVATKPANNFFIFITFFSPSHNIDYLKLKTRIEKHKKTQYIGYISCKMVTFMLNLN